ncbi:hypothetical protein QYE76_031306 [Lolium multiflorum]|uniref:Uncharacterized protein n=1 Tax=Lolium multiflorum TaxID=4521 RepID=A0AAD8QV11_LOLMU|nr:hypothetical protein QYE76_031306 [Lolium multiflorum]
MERDKRPASLLGTLRTAVNKVRFLLSFRATRWILTSIAGRSPAGAAGAAATQRRLSFGSRQPSLLDAEDERSAPSSSSTAGPSRTASLGATTVSRTSSAAYSRSASSGAETSSSTSGSGSSPAGDDDIDRRAELFIANFYRHIQMERQVSLQLRYCRADSFQDRTPPRLI